MNIYPMPKSVKGIFLFFWIFFEFFVFFAENSFAFEDCSGGVALQEMVTACGGYGIFGEKLWEFAFTDSRVGAGYDTVAKS